MSNGVLPALFVVAIVRKLVHNILVDTVQSDLFVGSITNGHRDQRNVRVRRFHHFLALV